MNQHRLPDQIPPPWRTPNAPTAGWAAWVRQQWGLVRVTHLDTNPLLSGVPGHMRMRVSVHLGSLRPADVLVEAAADASQRSTLPGEWSTRLCSTQSYRNGTYVFEGLLPLEAIEDRPLTVRVRPGAAHEALSTLQEVVRLFEVRFDPAVAVDDAWRSRPEPTLVTG